MRTISFGSNGLIIAALFAVFAISVVAQERAIEKKDYDRAESAALRKLVGRSYRLRTQTDSITASGTYSNLDISEYLPPDRKRLVATTTQPGFKSRTEFIVIGKDSFVRFNDKEWEVFKNAEFFGPPRDSGGIRRPTVLNETYRIDSGSKLGNTSVDVYQKIDGFERFPEYHRGKACLDRS